ncbi:MAG: hypothetical protein H6667_11725 [Ardenticatenaceae bacterium]|nr:hypothetical protein [Ardenticatenaceae bacterium]MCB9446183.1 hypothetical protein [Ardenticatenaceae bacterium]
MNGELSSFTYQNFFDELLDGRTIVIEAKNLKKPVNDQQFSRLCHIVQNMFKTTSHLGVFFSRSGATGFKTRRSLRDSRATQILFHAITQKFVVVFNHEEILRLKQAGSLPKLLEAKIRDIESSSSMPEDFNLDWKKINIPDHLAKWIPDVVNH